MSSARAYPSDIEACHKLLRDLNAMLVERDATLMTKDATILDRDALIADRDRIIAAHVALVEQQSRQLEEQQAELTKAIAERDLALQRAFRKRSERYLSDPKQFVLDFGNSPDVVDAAEGIADAAEEQDIAG
jgi:uncharacterized protein (DUF3084 family)